MAFKSFASGLVELGVKLSSIGTNILDGFKNMGDSIFELPKVLYDDFILGFKFLFVPSNDFFTDNFATFKSHFKFITDFTDIVDNMNSFSNSGSSPVISLSLDNNTYAMTGRVSFIDLSFYEPYKPIGDIMITAFVYLMFAWRFFSRIPEIISGAGMIQVTSSRIDDYTPKGGKK